MTSVEWGMPNAINEEALAVSKELFDKLKTFGKDDNTSDSRHDYIEVLRKTPDVRQIVGELLFQSGYSKQIEINPIGKGGFASVYSVEDRESGKSSAVKIVSFRLSSFVYFDGDFILSHEDYNDPTKTGIVKKQLRVFNREAEIIHRKSDVYGIPSTGGKKSFVIKLYYDEGDKRNLFDFILCIPMERYKRIFIDSPWRESEALCLARDVLKCLKGVHSEYIHRDIKPANILKKPKGGYVIIDWGGAKKTGEGDTHIEDLNKKDALMTDNGGKPVPRIPRSKGFSDPARVSVNENGVAEYNPEYEKKPIVDLYSLGIVMALLVYGKSEGNPAESNEIRYKNSESRMSDFINNGDLFEANKNYYDGVCVKEEMFAELKCSDAYKAIIRKATARQPGSETYTSAEQMLKDVESLFEGQSVKKVSQKKNVKLSFKKIVLTSAFVYAFAFLIFSMGKGNMKVNPLSEIFVALGTVAVFSLLGKLVAKKISLEKKDIVSAGVLWIINALISFLAARNSGVSIPTFMTVISLFVILIVCIPLSGIVRKKNKDGFGLIKTNVVCWMIYAAVTGICLGITVCAIPAIAAAKISMFLNGGTAEAVLMCAVFAAAAGATNGVIISMFEIAYKSER